MPGLSKLCMVVQTCTNKCWVNWWSHGCPAIIAVSTLLSLQLANKTNLPLFSRNSVCTKRQPSIQHVSQTYLHCFRVSFHEHVQWVCAHGLSLMTMIYLLSMSSNFQFKQACPALWSRPMARSCNLSAHQLFQSKIAPAALPHYAPDGNRRI